MKRVLIFSLNFYPRFVGGAEVAIKEITDRITDIEFHMVTLRFDATLPRIEKMGNVLVHRIGFATKNPSISDLGKFPLKINKYLYQIYAYWYANKLHASYAYDGIWAMMAHSCAIPAGLFKKKHTEVKYLLTLQEGDPPEVIERMMRPVWGLFKQGFVRADALQPISSFLQAWGRRMGFRGDDTVIPNGVATKVFAKEYAPEDIVRMKEMLGKKEGDVFLVTTSRLVHKNGIDTVIRALKHLPEHVSFLVYGIGPDEAMLRSLVDELDLGSRVRFMGEIVHAEIPLMLRACDVFIRASRSEGMGNSFIEAMAAGLPVIGTQEGGIIDFLFDAKRNPDKGATGFAVDVNAPEQIAERVKEILTHHEEVRSVTARAKALVMEKYDWSLVAEHIKTLFNRMF